MIMMSMFSSTEDYERMRDEAECFRWMRDTLAVVRLVIDADRDRYVVETRLARYAAKDTYEAAVRAAMEQSK